MKLLRKATLEPLHQTRLLLDALVKLPAGQRLYEEVGIGTHVRHIIDHFLVLRDGLAVNCVDYNNRNRDSEMERNIFVACNAIDEIKQWIETTDQLDKDRPIEILSEVSCQQTVNVSINSNLMRELHYVSYHCIHHLAYCALLAKQNDVEIDPAIGLAPGTASYLRAINA
jgi:hypothetical protein